MEPVAPSTESSSYSPLTETSGTAAAQSKYPHRIVAVRPSIRIQHTTRPAADCASLNPEIALTDFPVKSPNYRNTTTQRLHPQTQKTLQTRRPARYSRPISSHTLSKYQPPRNPQMVFAGYMGITCADPQSCRQSRHRCHSQAKHHQANDHHRPCGTWAPTTPSPAQRAANQANPNTFATPGWPTRPRSG